MIINASPLIVFSRINRLDLLKKVYDKLVISRAVYEEVIEKGMKINAPDAILVKDYVEKGFIEVRKLNDELQKKASFLTEVYKQLDYGEAETIVLALQEKESSILMDERIAREIARLNGLKPEGSLRVLLTAYKKKIIREKEVAEVFREITSSKFRISAEISNKFWDLFNKLKNRD